MEAGVVGGNEDAGEGCVPVVAVPVVGAEVLPVCVTLRETERFHG